MSGVFRTGSGLGLGLLRRLPPETAHNATVRLLATGVGLPPRPEPSPLLRTRFAGLRVDNPLGIAAGFDKNAQVPGPLHRLGFGFVEVGAVTPEPQPGNPQPRAFRLEADDAIINRYGFNNDGVAVIARRLAAFRDTPNGRAVTLGVNLGANKTSQDRAGDYVTGIARLAGLVDFYTVNISSPNTPGLRDLQGGDALDGLIARCLEARAEHAPGIPVLLKVAPDLDAEAIKAIADICRKRKIDGLIVSNTTLARPETLKSAHKDEAGGLSGRPLFRPATACLGAFYKRLGDDVPLVGVGGIFSGDDAYDKIRHGARLVQVYTGLVYKGPALVGDILDGLTQRLEADGHATLDAAIGAGLR